MTTQTFTASVAATILALAFLASPGFASEQATIEGGTQTIALGERASFLVAASGAGSMEFSGWCEIKSTGAASVVFDARDYIPLSEPAVGDVINFPRRSTRRFEMTGTFQKSAGNSYIGFYFSGVPAAFCFGSGACSTVEEGSASVTASCGQY
ncbi:hypothetical protein QMT40_000950 [Parvibaculaceae bacterium PLY_AMNH_Bact1]|nr:hypothetical protein QMT40_000950 [Parvibaculaceae bacterium PLY_AMNH_Bact1]